MQGFFGLFNCPERKNGIQFKFVLNFFLKLLKETTLGEIAYWGNASGQKSIYHEVKSDFTVGSRVQSDVDVHVVIWKQIVSGDEH